MASHPGKRRRFTIYLVMIEGVQCSYVAGVARSPYQARLMALEQVKQEKDSYHSVVVYKAPSGELQKPERVVIIRQGKHGGREHESSEAANPD